LALKKPNIAFGRKKFWEPLQSYNKHLPIINTLGQPQIRDHCAERDFVEPERPQAHEEALRIFERRRGLILDQLNRQPPEYGEHTNAPGPI
jgi:hypothetical protein